MAVAVACTDNTWPMHSTQRIRSRSWKERGKKTAVDEYSSSKYSISSSKLKSVVSQIGCKLTALNFLSILRAVWIGNLMVSVVWTFRIPKIIVKDRQ